MTPSSSPSIIVSVLGVPRKLRPHRRPLLTFRRSLTGLPAPGSVPRAADLTAWQSPVTDQGARNTCAMHAWCSAAEYLHVRDAHGDASKCVRLSRLALRYATQVLVYGGKAEDDFGALNADVATAFETYGAPAASLWPDDDSHFARTPDEAAVNDAMARRALLALPLPTLRHVKVSIAMGFPVIVGLGIPWSVEKDPAVAKSGVVPLPSPKDPIVGAHDGLLVGYDDDRRQVKFKNSWGLGFGEAGYGYFSYDFFGGEDVPLVEQLCNEAWTLRATEDE